ncbi:MAG: endolytic transglycosylase MltG [Ruminococcaceae bacterium]|nr:endolytic transglycosylase MltG [Oscillospiraceae bacterium]MBQ4047777.1 endolytic transglycosylase MltG [Clostridia bacterium]
MDKKPFDPSDAPQEETLVPGNELLKQLVSEAEEEAKEAAAEILAEEAKAEEPKTEESPAAAEPDSESPTGAPEPAAAEETPAKTEEAPADPPVEPEKAPPADDEVLPIPEPEDAPEEPPKQGLGCLTTFSYCLLIIGLSVLLSAFAILGANDMFALVKDDTEITVTIPENATLSEIADIMAEEEVINYSKLFWAFAKMTNMDNRILPGTYTLNSSMDYRTILSKIKYVPDTKKIVTVTIPEGMTQEDIFALLEENEVCEAYLLQAYAQYYEFSYKFLKDLPHTKTRLEGYLFPDTYDFYVGEAPERVLRKFLANFNRKWDVDLKSRAENINMSIRDVMIIASMIEREAKFDDERPTIASVIHNRLQDDDFPHLQIDATVHYAIGDWSRALTSSDLKVDSPYNTYRCEGLPAGPICNPGLAAIRAALYPEETEYYYYVARKNGWHFFAETNAEHEANILRAAEEDASAPGRDDDDILG